MHQPGLTLQCASNFQALDFRRHFSPRSHWGLHSPVKWNHSESCCKSWRWSCCILYICPCWNWHLHAVWQYTFKKKKKHEIIQAVSLLAGHWSLHKSLRALPAHPSHPRSPSESGLEHEVKGYIPFNLRPGNSVEEGKLKVNTIRPVHLGLERLRKIIRRKIEDLLLRAIYRCLLFLPSLAFCHQDKKRSEWTKSQTISEYQHHKG